MYKREGGQKETKPTSYLGKCSTVLSPPGPDLVFCIL